MSVTARETRADPNWISLVGVASLRPRNLLPKHPYGPEIARITLNRVRKRKLALDNARHLDYS